MIRLQSPVGLGSNPCNRFWVPLLLKSPLSSPLLTAASMDNHRPIATDAVAGGGSDSASANASASAAFPSPIPPPRPSFIPLFTSPSPHRPPPPPPPLPYPATDEIHHNGHALTPSDDEDDPSTSKKQKTLASLASPSDAAPSAAAASKKPKKKSTNVWNTTSRKGKKKTKPPTPLPAATPTQDQVLITPVPKLPDKSDDTPDAAICLSRFYKADKVELSDDRLTAGSGLGFRMVRATRGVADGAWYFEIRILRLGPTGHVRLGWTTGKGDLQAPVGYDANSFGYRDVDGCKLHKATREAYGGEGYGEGDVIGFYINLPDGLMYAPKPPQLVLYKGQRYMYAADGKDDPPKVIPGSEMSFYKNGVCQGVAFTDLFGGRYYPAASMYTMPHQLNCEVRFNFGPEFEFFPQGFGSRPTPRPMIEVPYQGSDGRVEAPVENGFHTEKASSSSAFKSV